MEPRRRPTVIATCAERHRNDTCTCAALQVLPKAALVEAKQIEHAVAERRLLAAVNSPFCVRLAAAFQDSKRLYLLMEWVPGAHSPVFPSRTAARPPPVTETCMAGSNFYQGCCLMSLSVC